MNKAQKIARKMYDENRKHVETCPDITEKELCRIAMQQNKLYLIIHERADSSEQGGVMTKDQAIKAINSGLKLTHTHFTPDEWMKDSTVGYEFEDGCKCTEEQFWFDRDSDSWLDGWSIYEKESALIEPEMIAGNPETRIADSEQEG